MKTIFKYAAAVMMTGAIAFAAVTPSEARYGHNAAAIGFGVGALAGAAIASSAYNGYYGYYDEPGYAYAPGYAYDDAYAYDAYAYEPSYAYAYEPSYSYVPAVHYGYYGDRWSRQHNTNNFSIDSQR